MRESAWFSALGNHDVKADGGEPELEAFRSLGDERLYRFTWGNAAASYSTQTLPSRPHDTVDCRVRDRFRLTCS